MPRRDVGPESFRDGNCCGCGTYPARRIQIRKDVWRCGGCALEGDAVRYEYAGFQYMIRNNRAWPVSGQHAAAGKTKHYMAALECWIKDGRPL